MMKGRRAQKSDDNREAGRKKKYQGRKGTRISGELRVYLGLERLLMGKKEKEAIAGLGKREQEGKT